ncbi:MAG: NADH-quinone oxidoreductase subunit J, partial [Actinomycetota bacterium]|nr:NADH-quinone oxidoreductase subunit J [Actinomycetota bacterium]
ALSKGNWASGAKGTVLSTSSPLSNVEQLARSIFTTYLLPFEATSVLLIIAVVGAVVLVRRSDVKSSPAELPEELQTESEMK